jgi:hypothetical protein
VTRKSGPGGALKQSSRKQMRFNIAYFTFECELIIFKDMFEGPSTRFNNSRSGNNFLLNIISNSKIGTNMFINRYKNKGDNFIINFNITLVILSRKILLGSNGVGTSKKRENIGFLKFHI